MPLTREAQLTRDGESVGEGQDLIVPISFASEEPYERWWGIEILDCSPESVDLARLQDGGALLFNHDWDELRGHHLPGSVRVDADRVCRADVAVSWAADGGKTIRLVEGGHLTKTSVGYEIITVVEQATSRVGEPIERMLDGRAFEAVIERAHREFRGDLSSFRSAIDRYAGPFERAEGSPVIYRVIKWRPLENSLVTVPADTSVGVGRSLDAIPNTTPLPTLEVKMTDVQVAAEKAAEIAAAERAAAQSVQSNITEILAIGDQFKQIDGPALARAAISAGTPVDTFRREIMQRLADNARQHQPEIGMPPNEVKQFSVVRAIRAMLSNDWTQAGLERAASEAAVQVAAKAGIQRQAENSFFLPVEVQRRDLVVSTGTAGGNMVATNLRPADFIELLRSRTLLRQLGARAMGGLVGNADITRQTGAATAYWLASETTAITESQQTIGLLQLRPKVVGAYTEISRLLLQQSTPDADMFVMDDLAKVLGVAVDAVGFAGDGASGKPTGILSTAGIGAFSGTSLALPALLDAQADVANANALTTGCAYVTTPTVASLLAQRQKFTSTDTPLWTGNILDGNVLGFRAASSTNLPAATMIFGDFSQVIIAEWGALEIAANPYANFAAGITGIRAFYTTDVGVRTAGAFSASSSIT